ncbi:MAG: DUF255 domain-containing protein [Natronomonas sp.]
MTFRDGTLVDWYEWGEKAFEAARTREVPICCSLTARWCQPCEEMDDVTYSEPRTAANLQDRYVPVRVDVDRRPRIRDRYNMGGFPSTVFLTPSGEHITGATYLDPEEMRRVFETVDRIWTDEGLDAGRVPRALESSSPPTGQVTAAIEAHMVEQVRSGFDEEFAGWGTDTKFPLPDAVAFALKRDRPHATKTLEAIRTHLFDSHDGGFYRFAETRRWGDKHREKLADENAALLSAFVIGYLYTGEAAYRETAEKTVEYLTSTLWTGEAFAGSQSDGEYYTLPPSERTEAAPPAVDETIFADRNGIVVDALLRFVAVTDHDEASKYAERSLDHVIDTHLVDGTLRHYVDPNVESPESSDENVSGLLVDHARVLAGLTTAVQVLGPDVWLEPATLIADDAIDRLVTSSGAFVDGDTTGEGLLDRPLRPLETNAEMATALLDLWALTGDEHYRRIAGEALAAFAGAADRIGIEAAGYATACARAHYDPLIVRTPPAGSDLHRVALRIADHEKVVVPEERDDALVIRSGTERGPFDSPDALIEGVGDDARGDDPGAP